VNGGPLVDITKAGTLPPNPLAVVPDEAHGGWVKAWDKIDFSPAIPSFEHSDASMQVHVDNCPDHVCGIEPHQTSCAPVVPLSILGGAHSINVTVSHEVLANGHMVPGGSWGAIPVWDPRFQTVESKATAKYTAASTFPPNPNAAATLESSE